MVNPIIEKPPPPPRYQILTVNLIIEQYTFSKLLIQYDDFASINNW